MNKVQLTLTNEEAKLLETKAVKLGYSLTRYLKYLISREAAEVVEEDIIPVYTMSKNAQTIAQKAKEDHKAGKTKEITSFDDLD